MRVGNTFLIKAKPKFDNDAWLGLECLTCVPIQTRMIEETMLTKEEKLWLKEYNQWCLELLGPHLDDKRLKWLRREADKGIKIAMGHERMATNGE